MAEYDNTNRGVLFINDRKQGDKHPDYKGSINVGGKEFWLSAWMKTGAKGEFISLSIEPKEAKSDAAPAPASKPASRGMDDKPPF
ncbi:Conserved hypothetical protein [Herminiimonas arsenicoxydans]|uniref:DUF736 domain-containing protein n=1 Tax=Herminiimonas arsenicoxydans TaxID=204773 RepID=A4G7F4_HERAR|nr:Conserved hypothetical protein [Herminiimonas arsenicoxydans]